MRAVATLLVVFLLLLGAMPTSGEASSQVIPVDSTAGCVNPPCGYITPLLSLDLLDNRPCGAGVSYGEPIDGTKCMPPPTAEEPKVMEGEFVLRWSITEEGYYTSDPNDPVVVEFLSPSSNPSFLDFTVEPSSFTLDASTLSDPSYIKSKERGDGSDELWYEYIQPVTVTIERTGEPTEEDLQSIMNRDGQVRFLIRIHSDGSGSTYRDSYGLELFAFHVDAAVEGDSLRAISTSEDGRGTPFPAAVGVAGLMLAAVAVRRRQS